MHTLTENMDCSVEAAQAHLQNATLAAIVDSSDDAIISKSLQGIVNTWNAAAERIFGYRAEEMIGQSILKLLPLDRVDEERQILAQLASGQRVDHLETVRTTKSGREIFVSVTSSPIRDASGKIVGASKIVRDITEKKQAEAELKNQQALLEHLARLNTMGEMASGLAHELNQPLTSILTYAGVLLDLLKAQDQSPQRIIPALQEVVAEARRAGEIIRRLREFIRKRAPEREPMDVNDRINDAVHLLSHDLALAEIQLRLELTESLPRVSADPVQFTQVLVNLLHNARDAVLDANAAAREICITSAVEAGHVIIQVIDRGCGVSDQQLQSLFERFFSTKFAGLGMGLAISKTIVESQGGYLTAAANPVGGGMTFTISLPIEINSQDGSGK